MIKQNALYFHIWYAVRLTIKFVSGTQVFARKSNLSLVVHHPVPVRETLDSIIKLEIDDQACFLRTSSLRIKRTFGWQTCFTRSNLPRKI